MDFHTQSLKQSVSGFKFKVSGVACLFEPVQNQKVRKSYAVPVAGIQILPTVNSNDDTLRVFYGRIRASN